MTAANLCLEGVVPGLGSKYLVLKYICQSTKMYLSTFSNSKYMYLNCT